MRRLLIGFVVGFVFGVLLVLGPHPVTDSPWPAPTPTPTPTTVELERQIDKAQCDAEKVAMEISCRLLYTGRPNPPKE